MIDATVGLGGHTEAMLRNHDELTVVGIDRDPEALRRAGDRLSDFGDRIRLVHAVFDALPDVLTELGRHQVDGILFDLGVSSMQLDQTDRGFSYSTDAPLDMRMDPSVGRSAADIVNSAPIGEIARILSRYGDERFARRIAGVLGRERERAPFTRTGRLADVVRDAIPAAARRTGGHPAKRTFQALRIAVNAELEVLEAVLPAAVNALAPGGRIVVLSYHSGEDRLVKKVLVDGATDHTPLDLPVTVAEHAPRLRLLTRGAQRPTEDEVAVNPRAASARMRAAERLVGVA